MPKCWEISSSKSCLRNTALYRKVDKYLNTISKQHGCFYEPLWDLFSLSNFKALPASSSGLSPDPSSSWCWPVKFSWTVSWIVSVPLCSNTVPCSASWDRWPNNYRIFVFKINPMRTGGNGNGRNNSKCWKSLTLNNF